MIKKLLIASLLIINSSYAVADPYWQSLSKDTNIMIDLDTLKQDATTGYISMWTGLKYNKPQNIDDDAKVKYDEMYLLVSVDCKNQKYSRLEGVFKYKKKEIWRLSQTATYNPYAYRYAVPDSSDMNIIDMVCYAWDRTHDKH
jgi:hypothetical protein